MSLNNDQLKEWFKDEFSDIKIRLSTNEGKSNEILRRLDVVTAQQKDLRDTMYGKGAMLEQFTILQSEHNRHMEQSSPDFKLNKKTLKVERIALGVSVVAVMIAVLKDVLQKFLF